jgi:hypothetical protein
MSLHHSRPGSRRARSARKKARAPAPRARSTPNPSRLEALETAEVDEISSEVEANPSDVEKEPSRSPHLEEGERLPVVEPGLSVAPEDLGLQFLRDATEQDNFESDENFGREAVNGNVPLGDVAAEAMAAAREALDAPEQRGRGAPGSDRDEPNASDLELDASALREGSLFDQPSEEGTEGYRIETDEAGDGEDAQGARETAEAQALARLRRLTRPRTVRRTHAPSRSRARR